MSSRGSISIINITSSLGAYRIFSSSCRSLCYYQVTFLPLLNEPCSFDLLVYTNKTAVVPKKWEDSDPRYIMNSQEVKLRSFTTSVSFDMSCVVGFEYVTFNPTHARTLFHNESFTKSNRWSRTRRQTSGSSDLGWGCWYITINCFPPFCVIVEIQACMAVWNY